MKQTLQTKGNQKKIMQFLSLKRLKDLILEKVTTQLKFINNRLCPTKILTRHSQEGRREGLRNQHQQPKQKRNKLLTQILLSI